ncbi:MAG: hypothetical protein GF334_08220, partial [Candidatus Altiarchaeales archaeon]|nr:hypothetical protein [Candidatus Altiarchaeales archaeon]
MLDLRDLDKETYSRLYLEELKTDAEIADLYGTYQQKTRRLRIKFGIPNITKAERVSGKFPPLDPLQEQLLVGSLLGDGSLSAPKNSKGARYSEGHSEKQKEYLRWKRDKLKP